MSFNRLLLVIKQTAFDAYTCRELAAAAAGVSRSHEGVRMAGTAPTTLPATTRISSPRFLSDTAAYDVASNILEAFACHIINTLVKPLLLELDGNL
jgi:hypothetical protein